MSSPVKQTLKWAQKLLPACDGDLNHAKRQLVWLKEKIISDRSGGAIHDKLSEQEQTQLEKYINQRVFDHKPLQYILGSQPFCDLDIVTRPPILIPRWETEEWTYKVIQLMHQYLDKSRPLRILDICTGSGCIALALAKHLPKDSAQIIGLDISNKAISLANHNLNIHKLSIRNAVEFREKDVFNLDLKEPVDMIVSNPPYITHDEYNSLDPDVKEWEDPRALVADEQGTRIHKRIIQVAKHCRPYNNDLPRLFMEVGGTHQIKPLTEEMQINGLNDIEVWKDLADKDRVIVAH
ncbi:S-adenosyl-L-methionine-dependent methyltransferase [Mucor mucedo]|uniref:S-adenosyl-L-methionine-dependent methyltransferase n=1 Tax=Mucor mucedo TaxID=29922 RepID=UPI002220010A|nr:S-adenosyl-L-methionine-dependent methyltransferase [Mucor mucedo]KAI7894139.1 S-adenosyl-L-methionine-dependent methyltransferase [Mucor mucedo]